MAMALGAMLVIAALLKAASPWRAIVAISETGWSQDARTMAVACSIVSEAFLGSILLCDAANRLVLRFAAAFAAILAVVHFAMRQRLEGACGCFGDVDLGLVPTLIGLLLGAFACWRYAACRSDGRKRRFKAAMVTLGVLLVVGILLRGWNLARDEAWEYMQVRLQVLALDTCVCVVGSASCLECRAMVERLAGDHDRNVVLVLSEDDAEYAPNTMSDNVGRILRVPVKHWWALLQEKTPSLLAWRKRGGLRVLDLPG